MNSAQKGDSVKVHYTGKLEDGTIFDSTRDRGPLNLTIGNGKTIPGFEKRIIGMKVGETRNITVPPEEAFGQKRNDLKILVKMSDFPEDITPAVGQYMQFKQSDGRMVNVKVIKISGEDVFLDANHPLAGETLKIEVKLVKIV
jgi:peptidylprolyl isomerase